MTRRSKLVADLVPPLAWRLLRRLRPKSATAAPAVVCDGVFGSYAEAAASEPVHDYDDEALVDIVYKKTLAYRTLLESRPLVATPAIQRIAMTLGLVAPDRSLRVLDFGGAFGTHYSIARALLPSRVALHWQVVETPATVRRALSLQTDELQFFDDLVAAVRSNGGIDLIYADGVLQALPDPLKTLAALVEVPTKYLCLQRVGTATQRVVTIAKIPLSLHEPDVPLAGEVDVIRALPMTYETQATYESFLGPRLRMRFGDGEGPAYRHDQFVVHMRGYFCELSSGQSRQ